MFVKRGSVLLMAILIPLIGCALSCIIMIGTERVVKKETVTAQKGGKDKEDFRETKEKDAKKTAISTIITKEGEQIGIIGSVNPATKEIIVQSPNYASKIRIGERLYVRIGEKAPVMRAAFPMQTVVKCRLEGKYAGYFGQIAKGMSVYRYVAGVEVEDKKEPKVGTVKMIEGIEFVYIRGGEFLMGSPEGEGYKGEHPQHKVKVSGFWMGKYEVTQDQYQSVMANNPSGFKGGNLPVETVSWYDAVEFCNTLSMNAGFIPYYTIDKKNKDPENKSQSDSLQWTVKANTKAKGFRLPTEAEWEYACRAGTNTKYYWGDKFDGKYCWISSNSDSKTHPVGQKIPNDFGLYDMPGNVHEWCEDGYRNYSSNQEENPKGPGGGPNRVHRGDSWFGYSSEVRSACRGYVSPAGKHSYIGFRLVKSNQ